MNYYDILGISRDATLKDIKTAYRTLSKKYHPDVNPEGEESFKRIVEAYETLSDANARKLYDYELENGFNPETGENQHTDSTPKNDFVDFSNHDFVDFSAERTETGIDWRELVDNNDNLYQKLKALFEQIIVLPNPELQTSVLLAFAMTPSAMSNNLPIGVLYGSSGSGKSETTKLIAALHNTQMSTAASTFASLRNVISSSRYYDSDKTFEKNFLLCWDDINESVFLADDKMFSLFKSGINRKAVITIADKLGINMEFYPFSPKLVSTVSPFWDHPKLLELKRRILPFLFKKVLDSENVIIHLVSVDDLNLNGLHNELESYWRFKENREIFNAAKRSLSRTRSTIIPLEIQRLYTDVMATLSTITGLSPKESLKQFELYYQFVEANILDSNIGVTRIFDEWLNQKEIDFLSVATLRNPNPPYKHRIPPIEVFRYFDNCYTNGEISSKVERSVVESLFINKGYQKLKTQAGYQWIKMIQ